MNYTVVFCQYVAPIGGNSANLILKVSQTIDGKEWEKDLKLTGDDAKKLWDQYTATTEQSTIDTLLAAK